MIIELLVWPHLTKNYISTLNVPAIRFITFGKGVPRMRQEARDRTIGLQLALLQEDLVRLQGRCAGLPLPPDVTIALRQFKELNPAFEAVAAFTSILRANTQSLDDERREQVQKELLQLSVALWMLHLNAVEPRLQRMVAGINHMPIGTRFVLERWVKQLKALRDDEPEIMAQLNKELLVHVMTLARRLADEAPDLPDLGSEG
jgi:hypothetical protein